MQYQKTICTLALLFALNSMQAQTPNQTTPRNTLEEVFKCARTGKFESVHLLCDPTGRNDGDTKRICSLNRSTPKEQKEFRRFFKLAYSSEVITINEDAAEVAFLFGPKVQQKETMRLVRRENKWYLSGF